MFSNIGLFELLIIFFFFLAPFILCVISLVDIVKSNFEGNNKIVWILVVILLPLVGSILYFTIGMKQKTEFPKFNG